MNASTIKNKIINFFMHYNIVVMHFIPSYTIAKAFTLVFFDLH